MPISEIKKHSIKACDPNIHHETLAEHALVNGDLQEVVDLLNSNRFITSLDLSRNAIGGNKDGLTAIKILKQLKFITELNLSSTDFTDSAAYELATSQFVRINLTRTSMSDAAANVFKEHAKQVYLNLDHTNVSQKLKEEVKKKIDANNTEILRRQLRPYRQESSTASNPVHKP